MATISNPTAATLRSTAASVQSAYNTLLAAVNSFSAACDAANREVQASAPGSYIAAGSHIGVPNTVQAALAARRPLDLPTLVESAWAGKLPAA
ncbi:hypothetical protein [Mesorhizobium sp. GR13]|uniref:hypothetical protein n=1 Tax=Mesorhizobium sp. GR13 TaxID=2562308 RepID=UPI0010C01568|nr:hypothetical protein [Mesorhizobium sp. GR13]